jgi:hypothetical protein
MPSTDAPASNPALVTYYTPSGTPLTQQVVMTHGQPALVDVNAYLLAHGFNASGAEVSAKVVLPGDGVAERKLSFNRNGWKGSTDVVGANQPSPEWDFAEGSTLSVFSEYLTLQNPTSGVVTATLTYYTDGGLSPQKTVVLPANSRTTIQVFTGSPTVNQTSCDPTASCGVGTGIGGVSVKVTATAGIVAERPMYVNGFGFQGPTPIYDGHDTLGAIAPAKSWSFAEGTTLPGFWEYLTIENPGSSQSSTKLSYQVDRGTPVTKNLVVPAHSRVTVQVFDSVNGVGPNIGGVSVVVSSDVPIVAERPMYMVHDFGSGPVAGATVVVGALSSANNFEFAQVSTAAGDWDYLTLQNATTTDAQVDVKFYDSAGNVYDRPVVVVANSRLTDPVFGGGGLPDGLSPVGVVVTSTNGVAVLVEKPTYSTVGNGGATDALGYTPPS